eukprot:2687357-Ditylum_brightwellii.AAC.1
MFFFFFLTSGFRAEQVFAFTRRLYPFSLVVAVVAVVIPHSSISMIFMERVEFHFLDISGRLLTYVPYVRVYCVSSASSAGR